MAQNNGNAGFISARGVKTLCPPRLCMILFIIIRWLNNPPNSLQGPFVMLYPPSFSKCKIIIHSQLSLTDALTKIDVDVDVDP